MKLPKKKDREKYDLFREKSSYKMLNEITMLATYMENTMLAQALIRKMNLHLRETVTNMI